MKRRIHHSLLKNPTQNGDRNRMLTGIDYVIVVVYLIGIMLLGFYFKRFVHSSKDFFWRERVNGTPRQA